jgi:hypothetical protein
MNPKILNRRYRCRRGLRLVSAAATVLGLWVRIPSGEWISVFCGYCVLSGRGFCDRPIPRPEESYRVCVCVCVRVCVWRVSACAYVRARMCVCVCMCVCENGNNNLFTYNE